MVVGFRCNTLQDFVNAAVAAKDVDHQAVRLYGERFLMDSVKWDFEQWFNDLYAVYESAENPGVKGWHRVEAPVEHEESQCLAANI